MKKYTLSGDKEQEVQVAKDMQYIVKTLIKNIPHLEHILLVGSFGRGEGTMHLANKRWCAVNDYDIIVLSEKKKSVKPLYSLSRFLAQQLSVDYVDISVQTPDTLRKLSTSIFDYDLRYGAKIIYGNTDLLEQLPELQSKNIPLYEALRLVHNRIAGMVGSSLSVLPAQKITDRKQYHTNQVVKLIFALTDAFAIQRTNYQLYYSEKINYSLNHLSEFPFSQKEQDIWKKMLFQIKEFKQNGKYSTLNSLQLEKQLKPLALKIYISLLQTYLSCSETMPKLLRLFVREKVPREHWKLHSFHYLKLRKNKFKPKYVSVSYISAIYALLSFIYFIPLFEIEEYSVPMHNLLSLFGLSTQDVTEENISSYVPKIYRIWEILCH